jgi:hypothetical protein
MAAERWTAEDSQERRDRIKATDDRLDEWARWQGVDPLTMSWKHATHGQRVSPSMRNGPSAPTRWWRNCRDACGSS